MTPCLICSPCVPRVDPAQQRNRGAADATPLQPAGRVGLPSDHPTLITTSPGHVYAHHQDDRRHGDHQRGDSMQKTGHGKSHPLGSGQPSLAGFLVDDPTKPGWLRVPTLGLSYLTGRDAGLHGSCQRRFVRFTGKCPRDGHRRLEPVSYLMFGAVQRGVRGRRAAENRMCSSVGQVPVAWSRDWSRACRS